MIPVTDQSILDQLNEPNNQINAGPVTDPAILAMLNGEQNVPKNEPLGAPTSRADRFMRGLKDPLDAGAQILENMMPVSVRDKINALNNNLARFGVFAPVPEGGMNQMISEEEKGYQQARATAGESGIDAYRLAGNIASTVPRRSRIAATAVPDWVPAPPPPARTSARAVCQALSCDVATTIRLPGSTPYRCQ